MSQANQSLKAEAWTGLSGPYSHITPILAGGRVAFSYMNGTVLTGAIQEPNGQYVGIGSVLGKDVVMATIDGGYSILGINIPHTTTMLNVSNNANYNDIEGWAPRIFLTNASASNGGISNGKLNLPWSSSAFGTTRPLNFTSVPEMVHGSTGYGFTLKNDGFTNTAFTAYGYEGSSTPYLQACAFRSFFAGQGVAGPAPEIIWRVKVRCCRWYENDSDWIIENNPYLYDDDQGHSEVRVFLFGTDANGSFNGSGLATSPNLTQGVTAVPAGTTNVLGGGQSIDDPAANAQATYYKTSYVEVPFLYQGYEGSHTDFGSAVNILGTGPGSTVEDGVAGGYTFATNTGQLASVSPSQHQAQYNALQDQINNTGWTEIEFYCKFTGNFLTMDGLQISIDNATQNSTILVDYVSLQPFNISPENLYGYQLYAQWGNNSIFSPDKGFDFTLGYPYITTGAFPNQPGTFNNFSFDQYLD